VKGLFVIFGNTFSGAEKVLCDYLSKQTDFDFKIFLINASKDAVNRFRDKLGIDRILISNARIRLSFLQRNLSSFFWRKLSHFVTLEILKHLTIEQFDFVYCNNTLESILIGLKSARFRIPVFYHIHDMVSSIRSPTRKFLLKKSLANAKTVFVPSKACKLELVQLGIAPDKVRVLYNYVDIGQCHYKLLVEKSNIITIGFVGALTKRKGLDVLLKSLDEIKKHHKLNSILKLEVAYHISNKSFERYLKRLIDKFGLQEKVSFHKSLSHNEMDAFYESCDFLVVPSRKDPLPTVVLEAISKGKLVIGSRIDGIPEMIIADDLLFQPGNHKDLALKITEILNFDLKKKEELFDLLKNNLRKNFSFETKRKVLLSEIRKVDLSTNSVGS